MKPYLLVVLACCLLHPTLARAAEVPHERWNYVRISILDDAGRDRLIEILRLSKEAGCTHILLAESRMSRLLERQTDAYYANVKAVQAVAKELNLQIIPMVFHIGYGGRYLYFGGDLLSGLPVKEMAFVVKDGVARPDPAGGLKVVNAGFEEADGDTVAGWTGQRYAGKNSFVDREVKHSGQQSIRISNLDKAHGPAGNAATLSQKIKVKPFQYYRISYWCRWEGTYPHMLSIMSDKGNRRLNHTEVWMKRKAETEWAKYENVFNTLDSTEITISFSTANRTTPVWLDDVKIEPAGLMLLVRRDLVPLTVTSEDGKTVYKEGEDFKPVFDPVVHEMPFRGELEIDHAPAVIELTPNSRIQDGQKLAVSFYHTMRIGSDQMVVSIQEPRVLEIMENEIRHVQQVWPSTGYFMNYDEIRIGMWEPQPDGRNLTPGQYLAEHTKKGYDLIRKYQPDAKVYTWSDMYTPTHNARPFKERGYYWLTNGNWDGSWEGLPKDVIIHNWYAPDERSIRFFADRGHEQILCGFYDGRSEANMKLNIHRWKTFSQGTAGVRGFMYTTWKSNYADMKPYFQLLDTYDQWAPSMAPLPRRPGATTQPAN